MTDDIVDFLRGHPDPIPPPHLPSLYSNANANAVDEIVRLREELGDLEAYAAAWTDTANRHARTADSWQARAERAEVDADRLAEALRNMAEHEQLASACRLCIVLDLHEREVEAR